MGLFSYSAVAENGDDSSDDVERIEVTGSHIKRIDSEGVSPVTVIDRNQLENSGYNSIGDVMRGLSAGSFGVTKNTPIQDAGGSSVIAFRGLRQGYVLYLLNGRRIPKDYSGNYDMNVIPLSALERIEIITDGASATYGSDAIGGVVNFITKKGDFGFSVAGGFSYPEQKGGDEYNVSSTYGWTGEDSQGLFNFMYRRVNPIWYKDRPFGPISLGKEQDKNRDYPGWSSIGSPGTFHANNETTPMNGCETITKSNICAFDYSTYMQYAPQMDIVSLFTENSIDTGDGSELYLRGIISVQQVIGKLAPAPAIVDIPDDVAQKWNLAPPAKMRYRLVDEKNGDKNLGNRIQTDIKSLVNLQTGWKSYIGETWNLDANIDIGGHGINGKHENYAKLSKLWELARKDIWNPNNPTNKGDISSALYKPTLDGYYAQGLFNLQADGELFSHNSLGVMQSAFGTRLGYEYLNTKVDKTTQVLDQWGGTSAAWGKGGRDFETVYGELLYFPVDSLEFQAAGSIDRYKGFGIAPAPKLGVRFQPVEAILLRGSWGKGFKAPSILSLYGNVLSHPYGADSFRCNQAKGTEQEDANCGPGQYEVQISGNPNLQPETSTFYNIGGMVEPFEGFSISANYFVNEIKNMIILSRSDTSVVNMVTQAEWDTRQNSEKRKVMTDRGFKVNRTSNNVIENIEATDFNIKGGLYKPHGFDVKVVLEQPIYEEATAYIKGQWDRLLGIKYYEGTLLKQDKKEEKKYKELLGTWGFPPNKMQVFLGVRLKNSFFMELSSRWIDSFYQKTDCSDEQKCTAKVSRYFDMNASMGGHLGIFGLSDKAKIIFSVENILNVNPPMFKEEGTPYSTSNVAGVSATAWTLGDFYATNGRTWRVNYSQQF